MAAAVRSSSTLGAIAALAVVGLLSAWLLVGIVAVAALTTPLSLSGLRSLLPILVPEHLWERVNALDSNGFVVAGLVGPPAAGVLVQVLGAPGAITVIAALLLLAALIVSRIREPASGATSSGGLLRDAWLGLRYTWGNATLRGLALSLAAFYGAAGVLAIVMPVIVLDRLGAGPAAVGAMWAVMAITGGIAAFLFGRRPSRGRERRWLSWSMLVTALGIALLLPDRGVALVVGAMAVVGFTYGPIDIALFTLRQRSTDPAWMGRAFAVSVALNGAGYPIGSILGGALIAESLEGAVLLASTACIGAAVVAWRLIPVAVGAADHPRHGQPDHAR
jgi:predicted MFS family arabinose efflux permease